MPKQYTTSSEGIPLKFNGPSTVEEYDKAAGREGACVEDAVRGIIAWDTLEDWRSAFPKRIAELTGIARAEDAEATARAKARSEKPDKVKPVLEKLGKYLARVRAAIAEGSANGLTAESLSTEGQLVADSITIDPSPARREGQPKKDLLEKAEQVLARETDALEAAVSKMLDNVSFDLERGDDGKPTQVSLARLIGAYVEWQKSAI